MTDEGRGLGCVVSLFDLAGGGCDAAVANSVVPLAAEGKSAESMDRLGLELRSQVTYVPPYLGAVAVGGGSADAEESGGSCRVT